jgi:predicted GTPase
MSEYNECITNLYRLVIRCIELCDDQIKKSEEAAIHKIEKLKSTLYPLRKYLNTVRNALNGNNQTYSIGFFGVFSSGKSSLINKLIGDDILPVANLPKSRSIVEISHSDNSDLELYFEDDQSKNFNFNNKPKECCDTINKFGCFNENSSKIATKISVKWPFKNWENFKTKKEQIKFFDTPGQASVHTQDEIKQHDLDELIAKAIKTLENIDVVIFTIPAGYSEERGIHEFYNNYIKQLDPLIAVNMLDEWMEDEKKTVEQLTDKIEMNYIYVNHSDIIPVSAKWAGKKETYEKSRIEKLMGKIDATIQNFKNPDFMTLKDKLNGLIYFSKEYKKYKISSPQHNICMNFKISLNKCQSFYQIDRSIINKVNELPEEWFKSII